MGLISEVHKQLKNPGRRDGPWYTRQPLDAWGYYKERLEERSKGTAPPEVPWAGGLGLRLTPGGDNPLWSGAAERAETALRRAGMSPAAAAAAAARVGSRVRLDIADAAKGFYEPLARGKARLEADARPIRTMSPDAAYLTGFVGGGGALGVADLAAGAGRSRSRSG